MSNLLPERIETDRIALRKPRMSDAAVIFSAYTQDPEVTRYLGWQPHKELSQTEASIEHCIASWESRSATPYIISPADRDLVAIGMLDARLVAPTTIEIGFALARAYWGRGVMPEGIRALANAALSTSSVFRVQAFCDVENTRSSRALEKSGFVLEGRLERYKVFPNVGPEPRACFMYARYR